MAGASPTHRGDEPVQRLPSLCVLDRDGAEVIAEPDGGDDAARVAVGNVLLGRGGGRVRIIHTNCVSWWVGVHFRGSLTNHKNGLSSLSLPARARLHGSLLPTLSPGASAISMYLDNITGGISDPCGYLKVDYMTWKHPSLKYESEHEI